MMHPGQFHALVDEIADCFDMLDSLREAVVAATQELQLEKEYMAKRHNELTRLMNRILENRGT